jgi:hypothetical protein
MLAFGFLGSISTPTRYAITFSDFLPANFNVDEPKAPNALLELSANRLQGIESRNNRMKHTYNFIVDPHRSY